MKSTKQLGIWMDHSKANIMELSDDKIINSTLESILAFPEQVQNLRMDESLMHNKEQDKQTNYYKKLSHIIIDYKDVLLFGPTEAKIELFNLLKVKPRFEKIKISVQATDKMTDNQQQAFLKNFFSDKGNN